MIEEDVLPKQFDAGNMQRYATIEPSEILAIRLTDDVSEMMENAFVTKAEKVRTVTYDKSGIERDWTVIRYGIDGGGSAYSGDWLVWNGAYLVIMGDKAFTEKYVKV